MSNLTRVYSTVVTTMALDSTRRGDGFWHVVFPKRDYMERSMPVLKKHPWLLPVGYVRRFYKFFIKRQDGAVALPAIQKGQERTKLLQEYGILPEKRR